jgi:hypothetical protein
MLAEAVVVALEEVTEVEDLEVVVMEETEERQYLKLYYL